MDSTVVSVTAAHNHRKKNGLSYKFQRLRERLRQAVAAGELTGKLPGERALAKRFHVNAKTLSKALTDLAAEGLLDRSIGRGTYVKGSTPAATPRAGRWLIVCEPERAGSTLGRLLREANPESEVVHDVSALRPSFLKQFDVVVDFGRDTPESFLRDMIVRNIRVVAVNREPGVYSLNLVGTDRALGAGFLTRDLVLGGHQRIAVVQSLARSSVPQAVQQTASRCAPDAVIQVCAKEQVVEAVRSGATAIICDSGAAGAEVKAVLESAQVRVPEDVSLGAIGCLDESTAVSGYFVDCDLLARTVTQVVAEENGSRPVNFWLVPRLVDKGTLRPLAARVAEQAA